jgi:hypothetical protein
MSGFALCLTETVSLYVKDQLDNSDPAMNLNCQSAVRLRLKCSISTHSTVTCSKAAILICCDEHPTTKIPTEGNSATLDA